MQEEEIPQEFIEIRPYKLGLKLDPPKLALFYFKPNESMLYKHDMEVNPQMELNEMFEQLYSIHGYYLIQVSQEQLVKFLFMIKQQYESQFTEEGEEDGEAQEYNLDKAMLDFQQAEEEDNEEIEQYDEEQGVFEEGEYSEENQNDQELMDHLMRRKQGEKVKSQNRKIEM